jgi:hypothetical protein
LRERPREEGRAEGRKRGINHRDADEGEKISQTSFSAEKTLSTFYAVLPVISDPFIFDA